jgi:hypothetical protein
VAKEWTGEVVSKGISLEGKKTFSPGTRFGVIFTYDLLTGVAGVDLLSYTSGTAGWKVSLQRDQFYALLKQQMLLVIYADKEDRSKISLESLHWN